MVIRYSKGEKPSYQTKLYNWSTHSKYIQSVITDLHIYGHGIELGMDQDEHLERVLATADKHNLLAVLSGDTLVGAVSLVPSLQEDAHYPGLSLFTGFIVVEPGHPGAASKLLRDLHKIASINGADWLCVTKRTGACTYTTRGFKLGRIQKDS